MTDVLIRDVPEDVLATIDAKAKRLGMSRTAYLQRTLERERVQADRPVTIDQLERFATLASDINDPKTMSAAWS